ncbi:NUDIX domain-containing protein [Deinococcus sp. SDU3-2]|uniref:NUDIX domain-containing protein n=1 Tax=Deinococcus terrestris TaxID=2651870 RepID=A0A7X1NXU1_9DEIO|nr:NUDIX domain-containing protein [Deinococcus terrestris]MPY67762.1 NUDIX domain-containing protein [Deinococcus terrestris]
MSTAPQLHLLARAVIENDGHVLLAQAQGHAHTFLPGGHVEPGEGLRTCLARELAEEMGLHVEIGAYLGVIEQGWQDGSWGRHHELNHLFAAASPGLTRLQAVMSREPHLTFAWVPVSELEDRALMPSPVRLWLAGKERGGNFFASTLEQG